MMKNDLKIVTLGGGTGAPIVLRALTKAGFRYISAICAATDSGGKTGIIRSDERDQVIAISDLLRNLMALIPPKRGASNNVSTFLEWMEYIDGRNRNWGYMTYYALLEKFENDFLQIQEEFEEVLNIKFAGTAIPVTSKPTTICFETKRNNIYRGEHELDFYAMSKDTVERVWIEPQVRATPEAMRAIKNATHIIFCPGSLYGSIVANFLPEGIKKALSKSTANKILISNLVSTRNETQGFTPMSYWSFFREHTKLKRPFDILVIPNLSRKAFENRYPKVAEYYAQEHSHFLGWSPKKWKKLKKKGVNVKTCDLFSLTPQYNRLRHDPDKLAEVLNKLIS